MSENQNYHRRLALTQCTEFSSPRRRPSAGKTDGTAIPDVPVLPTTLFRLEKLLAEDAVDLNAVGVVVRSDLGLVVHLLRLSDGEEFEPFGVLPSIEEIVVQLGLDRLRMLIASIPVLSQHPSGEVGINVCARFWMHSHLIALIAEELAVSEAEVTPADAYLAGLLHQIGRLPILLGWRIPEFEASNLKELGYALARAWNLPPTLASVIRGHEEAIESLPSYTLWKIAGSATEWVQLMEMMLAGDHDIT